MTASLRKSILTAAVLLISNSFGADDVLLTKGEKVEAEVSTQQGTYKIGGANASMKDVLAIRFAPDAPPARMPSGVFIRGGSLIAGTLVSVIGNDADVNSSALGALKLKREDIAGAFSPLPSGQAENMPELARYSALLGATLGTYGATLQPGKRTRVRYAGLDEILAERVMRVGGEQILLTTKGKGVETINRQFVRLLEMSTGEPPAPSPDETKFGPEVIVRLKAGDLLRGRVVKLDNAALTLHTSFMGDKIIDRSLLAVMFLAGTENAGVTWLSAQKPTKAVHTPLFDSDFPARMDASSDGGDMNIKGLPLERGIGVHSKSELEYTLPGTPARFIAVVGIDAETKGRGSVVARVLADGKEVWKSQPITGKDAPQLVNVDLGNAKSIVLAVDFGPDEDDSGDHFDWGWAAVVGK